MKKLLERHYEAIVKRGLINKTTSLLDFKIKINEEHRELIKAIYNDNDLNYTFNILSDDTKQEAIDIIMVIVNMLQHFNVDIEKELIKNIEIQEKRANEKQHQSRTRQKAHNAKRTS
jgi:NTP pyrophosphatase (non-canonical NTP hydrolase)